MVSRVEKYNGDNFSLETTQTRVSRNARLYEEVYDKNGDLENLPLADNTKDIDIHKLKELISSMDESSTSDDVSSNYDDSFWDNKKRNIDDEKIHDINKLLEKAKYENGKLKESENELLKTSRNILSKLDIDENYSFDDDKYSDVKSIAKDNKNDLDMTREMKYHTKQLSVDPLIEQVMPDNDLAMDLFFDLKPTDNTIVTKPIKDTSDSKSDNVSIKEIDAKKIDDTSDIDIIKKNVNGIDNDFFTSSYSFSSKDFSDDEYDDEKGGSILKIILLIIGVILLVGVIVYFVINFGIGS